MDIKEDNKHIIFNCYFLSMQNIAQGFLDDTNYKDIHILNSVQYNETYTALVWFIINTLNLRKGN